MAVEKKWTEDIDPISDGFQIGLFMHDLKNHGQKRALPIEYGSFVAFDSDA